MMFFVVAMVSVLFTTALASEIIDYDIDVYSWEDNNEIQALEVSLELKSTGLGRMLQDESTSDKSDDWPYESDDGPEVEKFLYSIVGLLCISVIVGFIIGFWCIFLRCSKVPEPQTQHVITPQVFTRGSVINV